MNVYARFKYCDMVKRRNIKINDEQAMNQFKTEVEESVRIK